MGAVGAEGAGTEGAGTEGGGTEAAGTAGPAVAEGTVAGRLTGATTGACNPPSCEGADGCAEAWGRVAAITTTALASSAGLMARYGS